MTRPEPSNRATPDTYFTGVVHAVFDDYFASLGAHFALEATCTFTIASEKTADGPNVYLLGDRNAHFFVRYDAPTWFASVLYLPTDGPRYCPRIEVGAIPETHVDPRRNTIEIAHMVPEGHELRRYFFMWPYTSAEECAASFAKVRDLVFDPFVPPFLNDSPRLVALIDKRERELGEEQETQWRNHHDTIHRTQAEAAWQRRDYVEVVASFSKIGDDRLSPAEIMKRELARKRMSDVLE